MGKGGLVDATPRPWPGVIAEQARLAVAFFLDGSWGEHQILEVADLLVRQGDPESVLDELGHFFTEEGGLLGGRGMAPSTDALVLLVKGPRLGGGPDRDTVVSPLREQGSGWVIQVF